MAHEAACRLPWPKRMRPNVPRGWQFLKLPRILKLSRCRAPIYGCPLRVRIAQATFIRSVRYFFSP